MVAHLGKLSAAYVSDACDSLSKGHNDGARCVKSFLISAAHDGEHTVFGPGLTARANVSNRAGADLFVSLHSNATGGGGWSSARGFVAYTSSGPESAERNQAAVDIINAVEGRGVVLFGTGKPYHELFTVLTATTAPAVLLECGFHTNQEDVALRSDSAYRDNLAAGIANGILAYLGMDAVEQPESGEPGQPSSWAKEAWKKAVALGIFDGTNPQGPLTREQAAVILNRLGLL